MFFIRNPGNNGSKWPLYNPKANYVTLDTAPKTVKKSLRSTQCGFWSFLKFMSG